MLLENPTDSFLQHALALENIKLGNEEEARRLFEEILNREPGYIGSYYHLGKLLERNNKTEEAVKVYEKGMEEAKKAGDNHAFGELRGAYEELTF
jgi:Tfp pilus assembly protein PilF